MKQCYKCSEFKETSEFYKNRARYDGFSTYCKRCELKISKEFGSRTEIKNRRNINNRKSRLGISNDVYLKRLEEQNGMCAICKRLPNKKEKALAVDHNHNTGQFRGLLCFNCNTALGKFQDDPEILLNAFIYLVSEHK